MRIHIAGSGDTYNLEKHKMGFKRELAATMAYPCSVFNISDEKLEKLISSKYKIIQKINCSK